MNLILDVGNTYIKLAVYKDNSLKYKSRVKNNTLEINLKHIFNNYTIENTIISSVGKLKANALEWLKKQNCVLILDANTKLPFKNLYKTPNTLGVDRIALVSASVNQFPNNNTLIIDAGTCITYDFVNNKNEYLGGAISPGITMRYKALNNFTANLPLLQIQETQTFIGNSTESSIHSGIIYGVLNEIDGFIEKYQAKYPDLTVILTGGDANFLSKQLKSSIFANSNFLLEGLNHILRFNLAE